MKNITITLTQKEAWVLWHLANSCAFTSGHDSDTVEPLGYLNWGVTRKQWRNKARRTTDNIWYKIDDKLKKQLGREEIYDLEILDALRG